MIALQSMQSSGLRCRALRSHPRLPPVPSWRKANKGGSPCRHCVCCPRCSCLAFAGAAAAQTVPLKTTPDHTVRSTPDTVVWGYFAADIPPVLRIKSGQTVRIDTVSHGGINLPEDPVEFFGKPGIKREEILQDALDIRAKVNRAARRQRACADRADLYRRGAARRHARGAHHRARAPRALWREQLRPRHRRAARSAQRAGAQGDQVRSQAQRRAVLQRHRDSAAAVHGHHGGGAHRRNPG